MRVKQQKLESTEMKNNGGEMAHLQSVARDETELD